MWPGIFLLCLMPHAFQQEDPYLTIDVPETYVEAGEENWVRIEVEVKPGLHIQTNTLGEDSPLVATRLEVNDHNGITTHKPSFPATVKFRMPGMDEDWDVYEGSFEIKVPVKADENLLKGKYLIGAELTYQACDNKMCFFPKTIPVQIPVIVIE